jgi:hypothetical protein
VYAGARYSIREYFSDDKYYTKVNPYFLDGHVLFYVHKYGRHNQDVPTSHFLVYDENAPWAAKIELMVANIKILKDADKRVFGVGQAVTREGLNQLLAETGGINIEVEKQSKEDESLFATQQIEEESQVSFKISNVTTSEVLKLDDGDSQKSDSNFNVFWNYSAVEDPINAAIFFSLVDANGDQITGASLRGAGEPGVYKKGYVTLSIPSLCSTLEFATEGCIQDEKFDPTSKYRLAVGGLNCTNPESNPGYCLKENREPIELVYSNWFTLKEELELEDKSVSYIESGTVTVNESTNTMTVSVSFGYMDTLKIEVPFTTKETILADSLKAIQNFGRNAQYVDEDRITIIF